MSSSGRGPRTGRPSRPSGKSTGSREAARSHARGRKGARAQKGRPAARRQMYRRRRIAVALLAIIVAAVLVVGVVLAVQAVQGIREGLSAPAPVADTPDPTAPGPEGDAASGACPSDTTRVAASTDEDEYEAGEEPVLGIEVTNGHTADCRIDVGEARQEFLIEHEGDTVWSSHYCEPEDGEDDDEGAEKNLLVFPAQSSKKASLTWPRIPVDDSCRQTDEAFPPGEYQLIVKLGETESEPVPFTLATDPEEDDRDGQDGDGHDGDGHDEDGQHDGAETAGEDSEG